MAAVTTVDVDHALAHKRGDTELLSRVKDGTCQRIFCVLISVELPGHILK